jgi:4-hydroxy-tetrahydrodipicolinate synthase
MKIAGVIVPLLTPLKPDRSLDEAALERLIEHVIDGGVSAIFMLGSTGEAPTFAAPEKERIVRAAAKRIGGRVPLLAGVIEGATGLAVAQTRALIAAGADAVVPTAPIYFHYSQRELAAHFTAIADASSVPVFVYNIPPLAKMILEPPLVAELARHPRIRGLKDSDGRLDAFQEFLAVRDRSPGFQVWQGAEAVAAISVARGADGLVLGLANIAPRLAVTLYRAAADGELEQAWAAQDALMRLFTIQRHRSFLAGLKTAADLLGLCGRTVSQPFEPLDDAQTARVRQTLAELELLEPVA